MKQLSFLFGLFLFVACANAKKGTNDHIGDSQDLGDIEMLSGEYHLISLNGKNISSEDFYLKIDDKGESLIINTGCNALRVDFIQKNDSISFQPPVSTKMYCEGKMTYENTLNLILPEVSEIQKNADDLVFLSKEKEILLTIRKTEKSE